MIRVAFIFEYNEGWLGGLNYFRNLISAIDALPGREIEPVIFVSDITPEQQMAGLPKTEVVRSSLFNPDSFAWRARMFLRRVFTRDILVEWLLHRHRVSVMSHSGFIGRGSSIPAIGWIPDFQHFHLPDFYRGDERDARIAQNRDVCIYCRCVLLSSYDAQKDLKDFFPECVEKSSVLQFVADVVLDGSQTGGEILHQKYGYTGRYFLVPNQFWAHKNHRVVIEALDVLRKRGQEVLVLATGNTHDHRQPEFFAKLQDYAKELNVEDRFRVLGMVSRQELMGLMHDAVALINPSLFEGWSTGVEEAKSLGKRIILSDIPVHHEQDPEGAIFFPPGDASALADAMVEMYCADDAARDSAMMARAKEALPQRRLNFAAAYQDIVLGAVRPCRPQ